MSSAIHYRADCCHVSNITRIPPVCMLHFKEKNFSGGSTGASRRLSGFPAFCVGVNQGIWCSGRALPVMSAFSLRCLVCVVCCRRLRVLVDLATSFNVTAQLHCHFLQLRTKTPASQSPVSLMWYLSLDLFLHCKMSWYSKMSHHPHSTQTCSMLLCKSTRQHVCSGQPCAAQQVCITNRAR